MNFKKNAERWVALCDASARGDLRFMETMQKSPVRDSQRPTRAELNAAVDAAMSDYAARIVKGSAKCRGFEVGDGWSGCNQSAGDCPACGK